MGILIDFYKYRVNYHKARMYWIASKCNYRELARFAGISTERARKWELQFVKERKKK